MKVWLGIEYLTKEGHLVIRRVSCRTDSEPPFKEITYVDGTKSTIQWFSKDKNVINKFNSTPVLDREEEIIEFSVW